MSLIQKYDRSCDFDQWERPDSISDLQEELTPVHLFELLMHRSGKEQVCFQKNEELNVTDNEIKVVTGILLLTGYYLSTSSQRILWEKFLDKLCANLLIPLRKGSKGRLSQNCVSEARYESFTHKIIPQGKQTRCAMCKLQWKATKRYKNFNIGSIQV